MSVVRPQIYLERRTYRRRRIVDGARLLPILGVLLFLVPLLWARAPVSMATSVMFVFLVWAGLIVIAGLISRHLMRAETDLAATPSFGTGSAASDRDGGT